MKNLARILFLLIATGAFVCYAFHLLTLTEVNSLLLMIIVCNLVLLSPME